MNNRLVIMLGLGLTASAAQAQLASDVATNAGYVVGQEYIQVGTAAGDQTGAVNGLNGGFGFSKWLRGGYGSSPNFGSTLITNVAASFNMGAQQFGLRSVAGVAGTGADARRSVLTPLVSGQGLAGSMMAGGGGAGTVNTAGQFGVEFRSTSLSNPGRDMVSVFGTPGGNWTYTDRAGTLSTGLAVVAGQRVDVLLSMTGGDNYSLKMTPFGGSAVTKTGLFISTGQQLSTAQWEVFQTDGDFYVNNLQAVPEPMSMFAIGTGLVGLAARRRRKK